jgi:hypothetical protein
MWVVVIDTFTINAQFAKSIFIVVFYLAIETHSPEAVIAVGAKSPNCAHGQVLSK